MPFTESAGGNGMDLSGDLILPGDDDFVPPPPDAPKTRKPRAPKAKTPLFDEEGQLLQPIQRLSADLKEAIALLSRREVRYIVELYYMMQENRKRANNQTKALEKAEEPNALLSWVLKNAETIENDIKRVLDPWGLRYDEGRWARSVVGIGPVLTAGLLAHIDITRAPTVGHIWRYAGLDPTVVWEKKQKRPWNAALKTLCWKVGQSFMKFQNHEDDFYGQLYVQRKRYEVARNESGALAEQAAHVLTIKNFRQDTVAISYYKRGLLPPAHIDARARRWAVKLFLSHFQYVAYSVHYGEPPPKPYVLSILGHVDEIQVPNWPIVA